jgi:hypothetical protein
MVSPRTREILLRQEDLIALLQLRGSRARRITSDSFCTFWFDLGDRHLVAAVEEFVPLSQNERDEALAVRPRWNPGHCQVEGKVLFENASIDDVFVVRTVLWFTDHVRFESAQQALAGLPAPTTNTDRKLHEIVAGSSGGHEECVSNPANVSSLTVPVANLVDVGFVAVVNGRSLACFTQANAYLRQTDFVDQLAHDFSECYQLVPLETALSERSDQLQLMVVR